MAFANRQLWIIIGAASSVVVLITLVLFTNLPFFFIDGKEIEVTGHFVNCVPTRVLDICHSSGFRDNGGRYYLITNLQQMVEANPSLATMMFLTDTEEQNSFHIIGVFSYGSPGNYVDADVLGGIEATSITLDNK